MFPDRTELAVRGKAKELHLYRVGYSNLVCPKCLGEKRPMSRMCYACWLKDIRPSDGLAESVKGLADLKSEAPSGLRMRTLKWLALWEIRLMTDGDVCMSMELLRMLLPKRQEWEIRILAEHCGQCIEEDLGR